MKVTFTGFARQQLRETANYIQRRFGEKYRDEFILKVREMKKLLAAHPNLGPIEPLLADLPSTYRSIVIGKLNKMVYRIVDDHIEIADFWDVRRAPETLAGRVK